MLRTIKIADGMSADADSNTQTVFSARGGAKGLFQVTLSGTASVRLYGRLTSAAGWVAVSSAFTSSGYAEVDLFPEMRVTVSGSSGGPSINAWLMI